MSQIEKLIQKVLNCSKDLRFDDIAKVLRYFNFEMSQPSGGSSHYIFRKGKKELSIPRKNPVKVIYVSMVKNEIIGEMKK